MTASGIPALLEPIQERLDAATPGPWFQGRESDRYENTREVYSEREVSATSEDVATFIHHPEDAALIANAPEDLARLLAAVKAVSELHCETKRDFITATDCIREECDCDDECPTEELPVCRHCWNQLEQIDPYFGEEHHVSEVMWPCPTVSAVEAALRGEA